MRGVFEHDDLEKSERTSTLAPGGFTWPALLAGTVVVGVVVAPIGAVMSAVVAFNANRWDQKTWRGAFIILAALLIVATVAGFYLLAPGGGESGPPGGGGVQG